MADKKDYQSTEKDKQELRDSALTDSKLEFNGFDDSIITRKDEKQLMIFIRNLNKFGEITESPVGAATTCIDTYERTVEHITINLSKNRKKLEEIYKLKPDLKDMTISLDDTDVTHTIVKENPLFFVEDHIKAVEPHIIKSNQSLKEFLKKYFEIYKEQTNKDIHKSMVIKYHNTSEDSIQYDAVDGEFIDYLQSKNYTSFDLDLNNKNFIVSKGLSYDFDNFKLVDAKLIYESSVDITFRLQNLELNNISISNKIEKISTINIQYKGLCKLHYINFTDRFVLFNIRGDEDNIIKWLNNKVDIYGFTYKNLEYTYDEKIRPIINIGTAHDVSLVGITILMEKFSMSVARVFECVNVLMNMCNFTTTDEFNKSLVVIESAESFSACACTAIQTIPQKEKHFLFSLIKGEIGAKYSIIRINCTKIGLMSIINDYSEKISVANSGTTESLLPFNYEMSGVKQVSFSKCYFKDTQKIKFAPLRCAIYDSLIESKELELYSSKKLFISDTSITSKDIKFLTDDECGYSFNNSVLKGENITVSGRAGEGTFKGEGLQIKCQDFKLISLEKISCVNTNIQSDKVEVSGMNVYGFDPMFINHRLSELILQGKFTNSVLTIANKRNTRTNITVKNATGNVSFLYENVISENQLNLDNDNIEIEFDTLSDKPKKVEMKLKAENECKGSIIVALTDAIEFVPVAAGAFKDFKYFDKEVDYEDVKISEDYTNKISYGYKKV